MVVAIARRSLPLIPGRILGLITLFSIGNRLQGAGGSTLGVERANSVLAATTGKLLNGVVVDAEPECEIGRAHV